MRKKNFHVSVEVILLLLAVVLFCYFRLKPIYLQSVPYTYDQGRDFLKAAEIVIGHNPTFLGPTTGIQGMYHGAWWYYVLALGHLLTGGNPQGFYYLIFAISLITAMLFYFFLRRGLSNYAGLLFLSIVASAPYFIKSSIFAINSVMTLPFILLLFASIMSHFKRKGSMLTTFFICLSVGFILEFELAFGFLLIPAFTITAVITKQLPALLGSRGKVLAGFLGFGIPLLPRLLFELKNNFMQSRALLSFFQNPSQTNPVTYKGLLTDRIETFVSYYGRLFAPSPEIVHGVIAIIAVCSVLIVAKKMRSSHRKTLFFVAVLACSLYVVSLINKNNFFWDNYLEGFPYLYILIMVIIFHYAYEKGPSLLKIIAVFVLSFFLATGIAAAYSDYQNKKPVPQEGLKVHLEVMEYVRKEAGDDEFCLRIYTPPVFAHTYNYITDWYVHTKDMKRPVSDFVDGQCRYIIERDSYLERVADWRAKNIPMSAEMTGRTEFGKNVVVELWKELPQ